MGWEEHLFALFDDLEQQAEALYDAERDVELADRSRAEYHHVSLASRLMASLDREVVLDLLGGGHGHRDPGQGRHGLVPGPRSGPGLGGAQRCRRWP